MRSTTIVVGLLIWSGSSNVTRSYSVMRFGGRPKGLPIIPGLLIQAQIFHQLNMAVDEKVGYRALADGA